jgi:hypothetical protein
VVFEGELALHRVEHGLDPLSDPAEFPEPGLLVLPVGSDEGRAEVVGDEGVEVDAGEAFVGDDDLFGPDETAQVASDAIPCPCQAGVTTQARSATTIELFCVRVACTKPAGSSVALGVMIQFSQPSEPSAECPSD